MSSSFDHLHIQITYSTDLCISTGIKTVAILSPTGTLGPYLLKALSNEGFAITAIVRQSSSGYIPPHIKVVRVGDDYPEDEIVAAFKDHDAVVLSLAVAALDKVVPLAEASVKAGVRRLIGSFYGANILDRDQDFFPINAIQWKNLQGLRQLESRSKNWSWTAIANGIFADLALENETFGIHPGTSSAQLLDGGRHVFTSTTRTQCGLATARVLKHLSKTKNKLIYIASFEKSLLEYLEVYKRVTGVQDWAVTSISSEEKRQESEKKIAEGNRAGLLGLALCTTASEKYKNHFSNVTTLANERLGLPKENLEDVLRAVIGIDPLISKEYSIAGLE